VLLDVQLGRFDIDLLDNAGQGAAGTQLAATAGAAGQLVFKELVDLLVREEGAFVFGMTGLAPALAFVLAGRCGGGGGLTMSEEGGLEEVEEFLRAAASCSSRRATAACNSSSCACNRWHPAQELVATSAIPSFYSWPA